MVRYLSVVDFADAAQVLPGNTNCLLALLAPRCLVYQQRTLATHRTKKLLGVKGKLTLDRACRPRRIGDEMLHLLVVGSHNALTDLADVRTLGLQQTADILPRPADKTVPSAAEYHAVLPDKVLKPIVGELKFFS
jgi:hypothetical protein